MILIYIKEFFFAYLATVGFAILFNSPKSSFNKSGFIGGLGWLIYTLTTDLTNSATISVFIASLVVAIMAEVFAIKYKNPITIYIIPGIIPLVPGFGLYYTMLYIVEKDFSLAADSGTEVLLISIGIAAALTIVLSVHSYIRERQRGKQL